MKKVDYDFLESKYSEVRESVINHIVNKTDLSKDIVIGIVDYDNDKNNSKIGHNELKSFMEIDLMHDREFNITLMAEMLITNDEGRYQLSKKK
jgi:hypothetical protein